MTTARELLSKIYAWYQAQISPVFRAQVKVFLGDPPAPQAASEPAPLGAIINGRTYADRLEQTGMECIAGPLTLCNDWVEFRRCFEHLAEWAGTAPARGTTDTAGNRNPDARYAGYRGEPALERYTADELAAWEEGQRARVPASVAGLSGDAEREALIERLKAQSLAHRYEAETDSADLIDEAVAALHSAGKPDGEGRLTKEARVGHAMFGVGVPERFVIEAAQRAAEHSQGLVDKEVAAGLRRIIQGNAERAAFLDSHPSVCAELAALIEENERLLGATADAPVAEPVGEIKDFNALPYEDAGADCVPIIHWRDEVYRHNVGTKLYAGRPSAPEEAKDAARLDALSRPGWELGVSDDPEVDPERLWQVHRRSGGWNDREWTLIGEGATPREAIDAALSQGDR